jgi:hypothetical protein
VAVIVESEGLNRAGTGLASSDPVCSPSMCQPPAADPVSVWIAAVLNTSSAAVSALLSHAAALRSAGAASLSATASTLQAADEANAAAITSGEPSAAASAMPAAVAAIPAPTLPPLPAVAPPPAALPGEQLAALVHSGPGSGSLRDTASQLRATASRVSMLADDTRTYSTLVDAKWQDGQQQAGANVAEHARWLDDVNRHLSSLADGAEEAASHVDTLIQQTPTPDEFAQARHQVRVAMAQFQASGGLNPVPLTTATAHLAKKQSQAVVAQQTYHVASTTTAAGLPAAPAPAPPIVRGEPAHKKQDTGKKKNEPGGAGDDTVDAQGEPGQPGPTGGQEPAAPQSGAGMVAPVTDPSTAAVPAMVAQIAGTLVGAGTGTLGQLASGLQGVAAAPLSALSSLTSGLGDTGSGWDPPTSLGADHGLGGVPDDGGSPDAGGGDGGSGATTPAGAGPVSGPAVSAAPISTAMPAGGLSAAASAPVSGTGGSGIGGMGMMPPMMGGMGGRPAERERDGKDRRVVLRPEPNTEPVFGELDRRRSRRTQQQEDER